MYIYIYFVTQIRTVITQIIVHFQRIRHSHGNQQPCKGTLTHEHELMPQHIGLGGSVLEWKITFRLPALFTDTHNHTLTQTHRLLCRAEYVCLVLVTWCVRLNGLFLFYFGRLYNNRCCRIFFLC